MYWLQQSPALVGQKQGYSLDEKFSIERTQRHRRCTVAADIFARLETLMGNRQ